ncbi:ribonuclease III [Candidatus Uhrbacteria bacterium]|nr:ribonuclease III [Candidatus Uhrbacteria bacterium]
MYSDMEARLAALEQRLGVEFKDRKLLLEAVTHRSYLNENRRHPVGHNELLEFLGDSALELAITEYLFKRFRGKETEGVLTNFRAALVNLDSCATIAIELKLDEAILMSRGEVKSGRGSKSWRVIMGNAMEAVLGAILVDQGIGAVRLVVDALFSARFSQIVARHEDPKSELQELVQDRQSITPHYSVVREWGPDHARHFRMAVYVGSMKIGEGEGDSKHEAEKQAARAALKTINRQSDA